MKKMSYNYLLFLIVQVLLFSCKKESTSTPPPDPPMNPVSGVLLKDIVIPLLPSPYYHFEYDMAGRANLASFASGLYTYDIVYSNDRISEMKNSFALNKFRLKYSYDNTGHVSEIEYVKSNGLVYRRIFFTYVGQKLIKAVREVNPGSGFILEKTTTFLYHPDGNLLELTIQRPAILIAGQTKANYTDRFEQYDTKVNTDGFSLMHDEFFDHLILLPGVQFRKNNPLKLIHTGDDVNYTIDYTYTYNDKDAPLTKKGNLLWLSGPDSGKRFEENAFYSYY